MKIYYSSKFAKEYKRLPGKVKTAAEKREKIFRVNPFDPGLKTHRLSGKLKDYFEFVGKDTAWLHSVGTHEIYG